MNHAARSAAPALAVALLVASCTGSPNAGVSPHTPATAQAGLNGLSAADLQAIIDSADLPTPNAHDATADKCPKLGCVGAVDSDIVSILKFDASGPAQVYAGSISNSYQVEDAVLVFAATVTEQQKSAYEQAVKRAII